jgi:folate-binding protein YgfZ
MSRSPLSNEGDWEGRWYLLRDRCVFRVTGPDRVRYLNGQVTNDVSRLVPGESIAACLCSIKGKVEDLVWIHGEAEALVLDGASERRDPIWTRLNRYLIADDCEIEEFPASLVHHFDPARGGVRSRRIDRAGWDLFLPLGTDFAAAAVSGEGAVPDSEWNLLEIRARIPRNGLEITGNEFPSELGLDAWAVDFHKGCYLGQEIVSRLRSVGRVKRELASIVCDQPLVAGEEVRDRAGNRGRTTRATVPSGEKTYEGLALFEKPGDIGQFSEFQRVVSKFDHIGQTL